MLESLALQERRRRVKSRPAHLLYSPRADQRLAGAIPAARGDAPARLVPLSSGGLRLGRGGNNKYALAAGRIVWNI